MKRVVIYPKDVQRITGKSERYGRILLCKIKRSKSKTKDQLVSLNEFAEFTGLPVAEIEPFLLD
jgi:hypothetical protein